MGAGARASSRRSRTASGSASSRSTSRSTLLHPGASSSSSSGRSGTGAVDDNRRLCEFIYRNLDAITKIVTTLDTHQAMQVFHADLARGRRRRASGRRTRSSAVADVESGPLARRRGRGAAASGSTPEYAQRHLAALRASARGVGQVASSRSGPYHAMLGGIGHALVPRGRGGDLLPTRVGAALAARLSSRRAESPLTEHYSVFGAGGDAAGPTASCSERANTRSCSRSS